MPWRRPREAQLAAYAGRYNGHEGIYDASGAFNRSGTAELVVGSDGQLSYKGTAFKTTSVCIDKSAGAHGKVMYFESGAGHFDVSDQRDSNGRPGLGRLAGRRHHGVH